MTFRGFSVKSNNAGPSRGRASRIFLSDPERIRTASIIKKTRPQPFPGTATGGGIWYVLYLVPLELRDAREPGGKILVGRDVVSHGPVVELLVRSHIEVSGAGEPEHDRPGLT